MWLRGVFCLCGQHSAADKLGGLRIPRQPSFSQLFRQLIQPYFDAPECGVALDVHGVKSAGDAVSEAINDVNFVWRKRLAGFPRTENQNAQAWLLYSGFFFGAVCSLDLLKAAMRQPAARRIERK